ncbi:hypothetical protein BpHYR1_009250 [Brachionus plicatilis]|uniref:Uncharacterized protein n=1 Tax=Brachionus plicatilis TaxID=10195 RepID=A0A3M7R0W7_BRAPC|nr:hypothetical protein BpHYR1_009250 [Brachionus plicatilis]
MAWNRCWDPYKRTQNRPKILKTIIIFLFKIFYKKEDDLRFWRSKILTALLTGQMSAKNRLYSKTSLRRWPTRRSPMVKIELTLQIEKALTRPEGIVSVLELVDRVGVCDCSWQGVPLFDYPVGKCVCPFYVKILKFKTHEYDAISDVNSNKLNRFQAANLYGIPRHLLVNHLIGRYKSTDVGRPTVYSTQEEEIISHMLQKMADWRYAINKDGLKEIVKNYAESLGKSDRFNNRQPKIPKFSS